MSKNETTIVAEIGINHQGDLNQAERLIEVAAQAGADVVKFQKREIAAIYSEEELAEPLVTRHGITLGHKLYDRELSIKDLLHLLGVARRNKVGFAVSCFDSYSFDQVHNTFGPNLAFHKIPSAFSDGSPDNLRHIAEVAKTKMLTVVSTGLSPDLPTVMKIARIFESEECPYCITHTTALYPTPPDRVELAVVQEFIREFQDYPHAMGVGYSGHEEDSFVPTVLAEAMGASYLERHITLDRTQEGADHTSSLNPDQFAQMVQAVRYFQDIIGTRHKHLRGDEKRPKVYVRKEPGEE